ncbi:MAG: OmpA family protein [Thermoguttaceae bacterium]
MPAKPQAGEPGIPEYMVSYADMLTIMLAFFIVLYATTGTTSTGTSKGEKTGHVEASKKSSGPKEGFGTKAGGGGKLAYGGDKDEGFAASESAAGSSASDAPDSASGRNEAEVRLERVFKSLYYRFGPDWTITNCWTGGPPQLRPGGLARLEPRRGARPARSPPGNDDVRARAPKPGDQVLIGGRIYFEEFSAELTDSQIGKLRSAVDLLAGKSQKIELRGHSSRRPLPQGSPYRDPWDLAYDRCRKVRDFLIAQGIDPQRIRLAVAGQNEPLDVEGDLLPTRQNARVEIRLLNEYIQSPTGHRETRPAASQAAPGRTRPPIAPKPAAPEPAGSKASAAMGGIQASPVPPKPASAPSSGMAPAQAARPALPAAGPNAAGN